MSPSFPTTIPLPGKVVLRNVTIEAPGIETVEGGEAEAAM
jgi:hypothetical protein